MTTLSAQTVFEDQRFSNLAIVWPVRSQYLELCHKGGPQEDKNLVLSKVFPLNGIKSAEHAEELAEEWFNSLGDTFEHEGAPVEAGEWSE